MLAAQARLLHMPTSQHPKFLLGLTGFDQSGSPYILIILKKNYHENDFIVLIIDYRINTMPYKLIYSIINGLIKK